MEDQKKADLGWQHQDETDNLQKSETPDAEYMKDRELCPVCHGVAHAGGPNNCPNKKV